MSNLQEIGWTAVLDERGERLAVKIYLDNDRVTQYAARAYESAGGKAKVGPFVFIAERRKNREKVVDGHRTFRWRDEANRALERARAEHGWDDETHRAICLRADAIARERYERGFTASGRWITYRAVKEAVEERYPTAKEQTQ